MYRLNNIGAIEGKAPPPLQLSVFETTSFLFYSAAGSNKPALSG